MKIILILIFSSSLINVSAQKVFDCWQIEDSIREYYSSQVKTEGALTYFMKLTFTDNSGNVNIKVAIKNDVIKYYKKHLNVREDLINDMISKDILIKREYPLKDTSIKWGESVDRKKLEEIEALPTQCVIDKFFNKNGTIKNEYSHDYFSVLVSYLFDKSILFHVKNDFQISSRFRIMLSNRRCFQ